MDTTDKRHNYKLREEVDHLRAIEATVRTFLEEFDRFPDRFFAAATVGMAERARLDELRTQPASAGGAAEQSNAA